MALAYLLKSTAADAVMAFCSQGYVAWSRIARSGMPTVGLIRSLYALGYGRPTSRRCSTGGASPYYANTSGPSVTMRLGRGATWKVWLVPMYPGAL